MKRLIIIAIALVLILIISLATINGKDRNYQKITPEDAKKMLEKNDDVFLIDVRTKEEYNEKHIEGSILVPLDVLEEKIDEVVKDKNKEIIVYCRSGRRSKKAANILLELGYNNVYDLGGIIDWPYKTE
ncbi:rhodanese-like domain-containing protein [Dethiothermospora halolimnae]|uniref:rhodanese-like domain-containing protein n=1 Tax=Dethiothermospora halolimnae TaxID=3114390 RepID=UPI003CCC3909